MKRGGTAIAMAAAVVVAGCTGGSSLGSSPAKRLPAKFADCPSLPPHDPHAGSAVDYVDFIQAFGQNYVAGIASRPTPVKRSDLGRVVLRSRCSFSALNDRTQQDPGEARDGDTAFLPAGTPIYAIQGWPTRCRLAARSDVGLVAYLALDPDAKNATARACALHH